MFRRLTTLLLVALLAGCGSDIVADSAELDRALIPAIDLTRHEELEPARAAMAELLTAWESFRDRHGNRRPADPAWAAALGDIDTLLSDVADLVEDGEDLRFAAANLVDVRMVLAELRESAGIEYYLDILAELWEPVEEIAELASRRDPDNLLPGDFLALGALLEEIDDILQDAVETPFDARRFGFDAELTDELFRRLDALADAGAELEEALAASSPARALAAARLMMPLYFEIHRLFGDYDLAAEPDSDPGER